MFSYGFFIFPYWLIHHDWGIYYFFLFFGLLKQIQVIILGCEYFSDNLEVSWNGATPKSSILIRIFHCKSASYWVPPFVAPSICFWTILEVDWYHNRLFPGRRSPRGTTPWWCRDVPRARCGLCLPERFTIEIQHVASRYDIQWIRLWEIFSGNSGNPSFWRQDYGL